MLCLTDKEKADIKEYLLHKKISDRYANFIQRGYVVLKCPFNYDDGCAIYEVRPEICKKFKCNMPEKQIEYNRDYYQNSKLHNMIDMREVFFGHKMSIEDIIYAINNIKI